MSAIRASHNRAAERKKRAAPYGRSILSTIGRYIGEFLGASRDEQEDLPERRPPSPPSQSSTETFIGVDQDEVLKVQAQPPPPPQAPLNLFRDDRPTIYSRSPPPQSRVPLTPVRNNLADPTGSSSDMTGIASMLSQTTGRTISAAEAEEVIRRLRRSTPPHEIEDRFRFSATPSRESTPSQPAPPSQPAGMPRRTLSRNPNGSYKWQGAGSAKTSRRRNRYGSPAFGATPAKQERPTESDGKRRKLDQDAPTFPTGSSRRTGSPEEGRTLPFPIVTTPARNNNNGIANKPPPPVLSPTSRLRTPAKPTVPVVPSPLRQAWSETSSASSQDRQSPSNPLKQSKTANFMAELIKETTPPKKPDVSNPYQTASPVSKVGPPRRASRRIRATGKPEKPAEEKKAEEGKKDSKADFKDLAPEAIIEATLPKGSKRSRPPANLLGSSASDVNGAHAPDDSRSLAAVPEDEDNERRAAKKPKPSLVSLGPAPELAALPGTSREDGKDDAFKHKDKSSPTVTSPGSATPTSTISPGARSTFIGAKTNSIPKEPSKLRFSIQAEASSSATPSPFAPPALLPVVTPSSTQATPAVTPPSSSFTFLAPTQPAKVTPPADPQSAAQDMALSKLPTYTFAGTVLTNFPSSAAHLEARKRAREVPISALPSYTFGLGTAGTSTPGASTSAFKLGAPSSSPFSFGSSSSSTAPSLSSLFAPTAAAPPKVEVKPFDFAAAGMKLKAPASDAWKCDLCGISNAKTASQCVACENPGPSSTPSSSSTAPTPFSVPPPKPEIKGFNFAAAGMKPPTPAADTWTCPVCSISNAKSASQCLACEAPNPTAGSSAPSSKPPSSLFGFSAPTASPPKAEVKGFDFAAAGMKPPTSAGDTWKCGLCCISNPTSAKLCQACETPKP